VDYYKSGSGINNNKIFNLGNEENEDLVDDEDSDDEE